MDSDSNPTLTLAEQLIACRSVTPDDGGCMTIIGERLRRIGFDCEFINRNGVTNLWARRGTASPVFCFAGHTDVVPTGPVPLTAKALAVLRAAGRTVLPDFVTTAGPSLADRPGSVRARVRGVFARLCQTPVTR